jgi:hypothetical protein
MMHGPCGLLNPNCSCTKGRASCKNRYPRPFCETTSHDKDSYPIYRRRDNGRKETVQGHVLDNRWVVPDNPYLLQLFNCHINVEACGSIKSVKYLLSTYTRAMIGRLWPWERLIIHTKGTLMKSSIIEMLGGWPPRSLVDDIWIWLELELATCKTTTTTSSWHAHGVFSSTRKDWTCG